MQHYSSYQLPKGKHMSSDMQWAVVHVNIYVHG